MDLELQEKLFDSGYLLLHSPQIHHDNKMSSFIKKNIYYAFILFVALFADYEAFIAQR